MKKLIIFFGALAAWGQLQTISNTVPSPVGGGAWTGKVTYRLNNPSSAQPLTYLTTALSTQSQMLCMGVTDSRCTSTTAAGAFAVSLYANTTIVPAGTSYSARWESSRGDATTETWVVGVGHTSLAQIRSTTVPSPTVMISPSQITSGGATSGQALVWNGSAWAAATVGAGTVYTASAVIDVIAVPDGSCVLDSTAVTLTGAALGGRPSLGASFQPPEGVTLVPKVSGPNSIKIEICNQSGASYNAASATYYFGVTP